MTDAQKIVDFLINTEDYMDFHNGFKKLLQLIEGKRKHVKELGLDDTSFLDDVMAIQMMIDYGEEHFIKKKSSVVYIHGVSDSSLSYLKAGALMEIEYLKEEKMQSDSKKIKEIIQDKISKITENINKPLFKDINPAECFSDAANDEKGAVPMKKSNIVFISYASEELALADFVKKVFKNWFGEQLEIFIAKRDIPPGENPLRVMMEKKLKFAEAIIPICSSKSKKSSWVWWESASVWARGKSVYPLFTNILPDEFGAPLTLVAQGQNYFEKKEFIKTIQAVCSQFSIPPSDQDFNEDESQEYKQLSEEYLKIETSAKVDISYEKLYISQDLHKYGLSVDVLNRSDRAFDDVVFELYFPTEYLETKEWDFPQLTSSISDDDARYTCLTFDFAGLPEKAKSKYKKDLYPGNKFRVFGNKGITTLRYEVDKDRWWKRFDYEIRWKLYVNKGAPLEGSIPLNALQYF